MIQATDSLVREHRLIERVLHVLEVAMQRLERNEDVANDFLEKALDFIENYSDRCHHGKEEDILFPILKSRGIPIDGGPIGVMLMEHEEGRRLIRILSAATKGYIEGDVAKKNEMIENALAFVRLLRQHIYKEDQILYPMANRALTKQDQMGLLTKFESMEYEKIGKAGSEHYAHMVEQLEKAWV
jgi:hemerythrin-like domain-containing protein